VVADGVRRRSSCARRRPKIDHDEKMLPRLVRELRGNSVQLDVEEDGAEAVPATLSTALCTARQTAVRKSAPAQPERETLNAQGVSYGGARPCEEMKVIEAHRRRPIEWRYYS
jgi:hypothetical protein